MSGRSRLDSQLCAALYAKGYTVIAIARQLGVGKSTVYRALTNAGVQMRGRVKSTPMPQITPYRRRYLPVQIAATRLKLAALENEAQRYGLLHIPKDQN